MNHLTQPLDELQARAGQFLADREARVLCVVVDEELSAPAGGMIEALEWHPENRRPMFQLSAPFSVKAPGWGARTEALREAYAAQVIAFDQRAIGLPALPPVETGPAPTHAFATTLAAVARAFSRDLETEGALILLAPGHTAERAAFAQSIAELAALPALAAVRWIWVAVLMPDEPTPPDLLARLGRGASVVPCRIDRAAQKRETDALLASLQVAAATGGMPGVARPRMAPPAHPSDPPASAQPVPGAPSPAFLGALLEGVSALRAGRPEEAFACFRRARDVCLAAGNTADAVDMEMLLGTVGAEVATRLSTSRAPVLALFDSAVQRAEEAGLLAQAAKAGLVLGCFARLAKDPERSGKAFVRAASSAAEAKIPLLQFHALRLAGELALDAGLKNRTQTLWREALDVAAAVPEVEAEATGLKESADQVAAAFKQQGFTAARPGGPGKAAEAIS